MVFGDRSGFFSAESTPARDRRTATVSSPFSHEPLFGSSLAFGSGGHATSETRASSSPPSLGAPGTPWSAQRTVGKKLSEVVFDMATPETDTTAAMQSFEDWRSSPGKALRSPSKQIKGSPFRGIRLDLSSRLPQPICASPAEGTPSKDAWNLDEWGSCATSTRKARSCSAAHRLDKGQREVADAVFAELQVDMDAVIQRTVNQMSSWISAEVAFARQGMEKESQKAQEEKARQDAEWKLSQTQFSSKVDLLESNLCNLSLSVGKLQDSAHFIGGRVERNLQEKVKAIELALDEQSRSCESLSRQTSYFDMMIGATRKDIDRHASQLTRLSERTGDARSDSHVGETRADLMAWEINRLHTAVSENNSELAQKASCAGLNKIQAWIEECHHMQKTSVDDLAKVLEQCRASGVAHSVVLNRHEEWMQEMALCL